MNETPDSLDNSFSIPGADKFGDKAKEMISRLAAMEVSRIKPAPLTEEDKEKTRKTLQIGDVVLVGSLGRVSSMLVGGALTHSMIYIGNDTFIHAEATGVTSIKLSEVFERYDTLAICRHKKADPSRIETALNYVKKQEGKAYDFGFEEGSEDFYCTELISFAYAAAGLEAPQPKKQPNPRLVPMLMGKEVIHPLDFIDSEFELQFLSHNLQFEGKDLEVKFGES